jgi:type IV secretory pathway component VirB8
MFPRKSTRPTKTLAESDDAPVGLYAEPVEEFAERDSRPRVEAHRMFIIALAAILLAAVAFVFAFIASQSRVIQPYFIETNSDKGIVNRPVRVENINPTDAVLKAELRKWVEKVYLIDDRLAVPGYREAALMAKDAGYGQLELFLTQQKVAEKIAQDPTTQRVAKVTSIDMSTKDVAFVFVVTRESNSRNVVGVETKYRVTIKFERIAPKDEQSLMANPLGLYITSFSSTEEK